MITDFEMRRAAPSIFADAPAPTVSERYTYISTFPIVDQVRSMGMVPVQAREGRKKAPDGRQYALHEIRFSPPGDSWAMRTRALGALTPQIIVRNSHDRTSGLTVSAGLYRLVCLNGLTVADQEYRLRVRHVGRAGEGVREGVAENMDRFGRIIDTAQYWSSVHLTRDQQRTFAQKALELRGTSLAVDAQDVIRARRTADQGDDLWRVFNRAQENLTNGYMVGRTQQNRMRYLNRITSLRSDMDLNNGLWQLATDTAKGM